MIDAKNELKPLTVDKLTRGRARARARFVRIVDLLPPLPVNYGDVIRWG